MTGRPTRRWLTAIPITGRFHIMLAILLLAEAGIVIGCLHVAHQQSESSMDLARVAAVQRSLDRSLQLQGNLASGLQDGRSAEHGNVATLVGELRTQITGTLALPATPEVASITDAVRTPAAQYLESADKFVEQGSDSGAWAFADLEPRRAALENALKDAMVRMRAVLQRVETRVLADAQQATLMTAWIIGGAIFAAVIAIAVFWMIARSISNSVRDISDVAQALAAGDMDNRCEPHGSDEVSSLARMINLLADTMQGMLTRLRSEAGRSSFSNQLVEALEMADSEAEADRVIARAMGAISDVHPMELLLADSSRAHLERACVHPKTGSPNCSVESPYSCIAVRRGHPQLFPDAEALNACPKLLGRMGGSLSAACVPVNFMGRALGVLHVAGAKGKPPNPEQIAQLTALGVHAGNRIGTLRAFERSQLQASTDSLTGLTNRRAAEEILSNLMAVDSAFAVVMTDLDFFKRLNDTQGHEAGDRALKLFSDTASGVVRDRDHVVRWGGEEFAMLLPGANAERAAEVVSRLRAALAQAHLVAGTPIFTASFGIADSTMARDRETLIRLADEALYRSKQAGRDCCTIAEPKEGAFGLRRERDQGAVVDITQVARGS
ncbi:MAG TPA: diguanylate cyclase [Steroidobacteraceae bacterium]|nr:diguanylate cyclase [Steroidobacteraceae bacterium]